MLLFFKFPPNMTKLIMSCVTTSIIAVLVNDSKINFFNPNRGIRQGDPMSPYIFILCMEILSRYINHQFDIKQWIPIKICTKGPALSNLFFVDDLILMGKINNTTYSTIWNGLNLFCQLSGQNIMLNPKLYFQKIAQEIVSITPPPTLALRVVIPSAIT